MHYLGAEWPASSFALAAGWRRAEEDHSTETAALLVSDGHVSPASLTRHSATANLKSTLTLNLTTGTKTNQTAAVLLSKTCGSMYISVYLSKPQRHAAGFNWNPLHCQASRRTHPEAPHGNFHHTAWVGCISEAWKQTTKPVLAESSEPAWSTFFVQQEV